MNKRKIRAKAPSIYIQDFWDENDELPKSLKSHLINSIDGFGITSDDYLIFLEKRAKVLFDELSARINLSHSVNKQDFEIKELIISGENELVEFKSTLRFDVREGIVNKKLEYVIAKTISAFLNSEGGTLVMGVDDDGNVIGLDRDYNTLQKKDKDGFELHLRQLVNKYLGESFEKYIKTSFPKIDDEEICLVKVLRSSKPVFINYEGNEAFYVRNGNSSTPKNRREQSEYEKAHWS